MLPAMLKACNRAITAAFWIPISLSVVALLSAMSMKWRSFKKKKSSWWIFEGIIAIAL